MEIILLAIGGIIWAVIKALSAAPPNPPPPRQRLHPQSTTVPSDSVSPPAPVTTRSGVYFSDDTSMDIELDEQENTEVSEGLFRPDNLLQGIIMAEVLRPPRSRKHHHTSR